MTFALRLFLKIGRQSHLVGFVSDGHCIQVRLVVVSIIVVFVVFTAGVQQVSTRLRYYINVGSTTPTHDANPRASMLRSQHHKSTINKETHMLDMCQRISVFLIQMRNTQPKLLLIFELWLNMNRRGDPQGSSLRTNVVTSYPFFCTLRINPTYSIVIGLCSLQVLSCLTSSSRLSYLVIHSPNIPRSHIN